MKEQSARTLKALCLKCRNRTNHRIVGTHETSESDQDITVWYEWDILVCAGCDTVTFREATSCSEDIDYSTCKPAVSEKFYPPRSPTTLPVRPFNRVPRKLLRIYREVIDCFNGECPTLCAAGVRALVEGICVDQGVKKGPVQVQTKQGMKTEQRKDLQGKIEGMVARGLLTRQHATALHKHRFLGNDAVHELSVPGGDSLAAAIQIVEHTLDNLYELKHTAKRVRRRTR